MKKRSWRAPEARSRRTRGAFGLRAAAYLTVCLTLLVPPRAEVVPVLRDTVAARPAPLPQPEPRARRQPLERPPNVLIVVTDDQRADQTLEVMEQTRDFYGEGGTTFVNAFVTTPLCCPSRASILTGRYAHNHGVHTNYDPAPFDARFGLPRYLQRAGYRTAIVGKYLSSWDISEAPPFFDRWAVEDAYAYNGVQFNVDGKHRVVHRYSTDYMADKAVSYLRAFERNDETPWFLYVAPLAPHEPSTPHPRHADASVPGRSASPAVPSGNVGKPPFLRDFSVGRRWTRTLPRRQQRTLLSVDDMIGSLTAELRELREDERTLAFYTSDNGYMWGEFGVTEKRLPYRPSVAVPLLMRWPGRVTAGVDDERLVANIDIAPTIAEAAGMTKRRRMFDGRSLFGEYRRTGLLLEYWRDPKVSVPSWASLRTLTSVYTEYYGETGVIFREYYDLQVDPYEMRNLAAHPRLPPLATSAQRLAEFRSCRGKTCP